MQQVNLPYIMPCKQENYVRLIMSILTFLYMLMALTLDSLTKRSTKYPSSLSVTLSRWSISCFAKPCRLQETGRCGGPPL